MKRLAIVITARPSYARIQTVVEALASHPTIRPILISAASARLERTGEVERELPPDLVARRLSTVIEGDSHAAMAKSTGLLTIELASAFEDLRPDAVLTIADRHETLATAIAASYQNLPLVQHLAGETSGSIDDRVRWAVSALATLHLCATAQATEACRARGLKAVRTGCPSVDLALRAVAGPYEPRLCVGSGSDITLTGPYALVLFHPDTRVCSHGEHMRQILEALYAACLPMLVFWPGDDAGAFAISKAIRVWRDARPHAALRTVRHVPASVFYRLLHRTTVLVGNSSVGFREGAALGVPTVNVGRRQDGRETAGNVVTVAPDQDAIYEAIQQWRLCPRPTPSTLYGAGNATAAVVKALEVLWT